MTSDETYVPKHLKPKGPQHFRPTPAPAGAPQRRTALRVVQGLAVGALAGAVLAPGAAGAATVTVRRGDTLGGIAQRNGVTVRELARINGIANPDRIRAGATLTLPSTKRRTPPATARPTVAAAAPRTTPAAGTRSTATPTAAAATKPAATAAAATKPAAQRPAKKPVAKPVTLHPRISAAQRQRMVPIFKGAAKRQGVPADLLMTMCYRESDWTQAAVSSAGAKGVCQIMPDTAKTLSNAPRLNGRTNYEKEADNIEMGAMFLGHLLKTQPDTRTALIAYNQGPTRTNRGEVVPDAAVYAETILRSRKNFRNL